MNKYCPFCSKEDIACLVKRKSDDKEFYLGLSDLKAKDKKAKNYQFLDDYALFMQQ